MLLSRTSRKVSGAKADLLLSHPSGQQATSKRQTRGDLYEAVIRLAAPGDVVFFVSDARARGEFTAFNRIYRRWQGIHPSDTTRWHTAIYTGAAKERRSNS